MDIEILGTRGEIEASAPYHAKKSGVLIDNQLLLDCGDVRFLATKPRAVLITHLHPDHAYFVREGDINAIKHAPLYAPEPYAGLSITITKEPFKIGSYTITPIPTVHSVKVASNAYLIEHGGKRILYTGDMIWIEKKYCHLLKPCDTIITEASAIKEGGLIRRNKKTGQIYGHAGVPNLIRFFAPYTPWLIFVHFGSWFYTDMRRSRQQFAQLGREYGIRITVGYDNQQIKL